MKPIMISVLVDPKTKEYAFIHALQIQNNEGRKDVELVDSDKLIGIVCLRNITEDTVEVNLEKWSLIDQGIYYTIGSHPGDATTLYDIYLEYKEKTLQNK